MSEYDYDNAIFRLATAQEAEPEDYTGEDGLLYCGKCRQPKEAYFAEGKTLFGRDCKVYNKNVGKIQNKNVCFPTFLFCIYGDIDTLTLEV